MWNVSKVVSRSIVWLDSNTVQGLEVTDRVVVGKSLATRVGRAQTETVVEAGGRRASDIASRQLVGAAEGESGTVDSVGRVDRRHLTARHVGVVRSDGA